jgi:hypothetical protein
MEGTGRFVSVLALTLAGLVNAGAAAAADVVSEKSDTQSDTKKSAPSPSEAATAAPRPSSKAGSNDKTTDTKAGDSNAPVSGDADDATAPESGKRLEQSPEPAKKATPATEEDGDAQKVISTVPAPGGQPAGSIDGEVVTTEAKKGAVLRGEWTRSILFSTQDGSFRFQPRGWVQPRFGVAISTDDELKREDRFEGTGFSIQRARFGFQAWIYEWGRFYLDTGWKSGTAQLIDYFVDVGPENGAGAVGVRVGFFRPYFVRQLLHATTKLAMVDYARAWSDGSLALGLGISGRQLGIGLQGFVVGGLEYGVGIWNGSDGYDTDADFMYGGRVAVHPLALAGVGEAVRPGDESDIGRSSKPSLSIGAALYLENRDEITTDVVSIPYEDLEMKTGVDVAFKINGLSLEGEFFLVKRWARERAIRDVLDDSDRSAPGVGAYVQGGYLVVDNRLELVGRFDFVDENTAFRGIRFFPTVGATVFIYGNNLKVQTQYRINIGTQYKEDDPDYIPVSHDLLFMLQASI